MKLLKFLSVSFLSLVCLSFAGFFGCAVIPKSDGGAPPEKYTAIFYEEDGVTVYFQTELNANERLTAPDGNPEDSEQRKKFLGWGVFNGESYSETPFDFDGLTSGIVENMKFKALYGQYEYTPIVK